MIKKITIILIFFIEVWTTRLWLICSKFADFFHFSYFDMQLKIEEAVHNDKGFPSAIARIFHNKIVFFFHDTSSSYMRFWDIRFGAGFFTIIGYFGLFCGFWYLLKSKIKFNKLIAIIYLLIPFTEVFRLIHSYQIDLIILSFPYQIISLYGIWNFIQQYNKKGLALVVVLIILSIWYIYALPQDILLSCFKK